MTYKQLIIQVFTLEHLLIMLSDKDLATYSFDECALVQLINALMLISFIFRQVSLRVSYSNSASHAED